MRTRKLFMILAAVALPLASIALLEGAASAGKVTGQGTTSCKFGGTINFNPPLTPKGSTATKKEVTTVTASLFSCTGGKPPGPNTLAQVKPIKTKTPKGQAGGTCQSFFNAAGNLVVKVKVKWAGEKPSKFSLVHPAESVNGSGEAGFSGSFPVAGSYAGTGHVSAFITKADTSRLLTCSGSIASVHLDSSTSHGSI